MKVFIVGGDRLIQKMFENRGHTMADLPENADLLCFTGGSDVSPDLYDHALHPQTRYNYQRDLVEKRIFEMYRDIPKVGICRGGQFLNVMSGGTLWQDVDNHALGKTHDMKYNPKGSYNYKWDVDDERDPNQSFKVVAVTSTHHQMMRPDKDTSELWGWCARSTHRDLGGQNKRRRDYQESPDVEIVWYKDSLSLCFQPHPEYGVKTCEELFFQCVDRAFPAIAAAKAAA